MALDQGRITDEGIAQLKDRIGSNFSGDYLFTHNKVMTRQAIAHWCDSIGDYDNRLYRDKEYAKNTRYGSIIAPPCSLSSVYLITGMRAGGLPGVHSFHAGWDWLWLKPVKLNDTISCTYRPVDIVEKVSEFAKKTVIIYAEGVYRNQRDETVAKCIGWSIRAERGAASEKGKYREVKVHRIDEEQQKYIEECYEKEEVRGAKTRYWEDVKEGDELPQLIKGPLSIGDMNSWLGGMGSGGEAHVFRLSALRKHPDWGWRNPETGARETVGSGVHGQDKASKGIAIPVAYDLGCQRNSWVSQILTNWMGDDGWLKTLYCEYRRFNVFGDIQWIKGKVTKKRVEDGEHLVDCEVWSENQNGEITAPARGTVVLPSRAA